MVAGSGTGLVNGPMDHLWRHAKGVVLANRQNADIDQQAVAGGGLVPVAHAT
jgi:hypothetical protein